MPRFELDAWLQAIHERDVTAILAPLADDIEIHVESMPEPLRGKATLRPLIEDALRAMETVHMEARKRVEQGNDVAALIHARATYKDDVEFAGLVLPVAGKTVELDSALFATLDANGRIKTVHRIRDNWALFQQLDISERKMEELTRMAHKLTR